MHYRARMHQARAVALAALVSLVAGACGEPGVVVATPPSPTARPAASATAGVAVAPSRPEPGMPTPRTGTQEPVVHSEPIAGRIVGTGKVGGDEVLAVELPRTDDTLAEALQPWRGGAITVAVEGGGPAPYAFVESELSAPMLWIKRPPKGATFVATLFVSALGRERGHRYSVRVAGARPAPDAKTVDRWAAALSHHLRTYELGEGGPFYAFASERALALMANKKKAAPSAVRVRTVPGRRSSSGDLDFLMETTTGVTSIQEALQHERGLFLGSVRVKPSEPIDKIAGPKLVAHPFGEMLRALGKPVPAEPLAAATPAEFYFVRFASLAALFRVVDAVDLWGTPIARVLDGRSEDRGLSARYEAELGLGRGPLTRALGPEAVSAIALVGSDPYAREGTDVTLVFQVKSRALFDAGLASSLAGHSAAHGALDMASSRYDGIDIHVARSADGVVRQHRAAIGDLELVSNSRGAIVRVLDAARGKRPRLSDEADFRYMLARDQDVRADVLGFAGDRFVAEVVGPRQKILEARRQIALAELSTPPFAALLFGWVNGRSPASVDELVQSGLLAKTELAHAGGEAIAWKPGDPARSSWGTQAALTPLVDLPAPTLVTPAERAGYERFAQSYQLAWSTYVDPAMLRIALDEAEGGVRMVGDLRILPLIEATEYDEIVETVGSAAVTAPPIVSGARAVVGLGENARVRREIGGLLRGAVGRHSLAFDWLGDWAMIGAADRPGLAAGAYALGEGDVPERPQTDAEREGKPHRRGDDVATLAELPVYAAVGVGSTAGAALALGAARKVADDVLPGMIEWGQGPAYKGASIVRIAFREGDRGRRGDPDGGSELEIFYTLAGDALMVSLDERVLHQLIDDRREGKATGAAKVAPPKGPGPAPDAPQLVIDVAGAERGPIWTLAAWGLELEAMRSARASAAAAAALLRGAPERAADSAAVRALALAYFGAVPVPPDGGAYTLGPDGVRDPVRGPEYAPVWPAVPVPGSSVETFLRNVRRFRSELSFAQEGKSREGKTMRSLHARVTLDIEK